MSTVIHQKVELANRGEYPNAIIRLKSGWVMLAEKLPVEGYCLLFSDPVAANLNALTESQRAQYCLDMIRVGDALLKVTGALRINYETWGNLDPALHTHIVPRYATETADKRVLPVCKAYESSQARAFNLRKDSDLIAKMRTELKPFAL